MNNFNMLSAKKVKMHGMTSSRWITKDKITQYKGLINLYTRDKKIFELDNNVAARKQDKELKTLQNEIENNRKHLDDAIRGDRQKLRNALAEHTELQLAYQNAPPKKVLDMVHQVNFTKRKELDKLSYKMKLKSQDLIDLKLKHADLEDRLQLETTSWQKTIPEEQEAQIITGKVQDAILKKEAALAIRQTYNKMIEIMKKDALYFDAVLATIRNDGINQGKCMINATRLGQLATEYLDDRKREFQILEKAVRKDMQIRKADLANAHEKVEHFLSNTRNLLRRDSDINIGQIKIEETESTLALNVDLQHFEQILSQLKYAIYVPTFQSIYPCLQQQVEMKNKLQEFVEKAEQDRDILVAKQNHATLMRITLETTMIDTTLIYKYAKRDLLEDIKKEVKRKSDIEILIKSRLNLLANIRIALRNLQQIGKLMTTPKEVPIKYMNLHHLKQSHELLLKKPIEDEIDGSKIITEITANFNKLLSHDATCEASKDAEYKYFEEMIHQRTRSVPLEKPIIEESLIEGIFLDAHIFNREDIKKQSAEIVAINTVNEDYIPVMPRRRRRKFKK